MAFDLVRALIVLLILVSHCDTAADTDPTVCPSVKGGQGPPGHPGIQGVRGYKGDKGNEGRAGAGGEKGDPGSRGVPGVRGPVGPPGVMGATGKSGSTGPQGPTGSTGPQGPVGPPGLPGSKGHTGLKGNKGIRGPTGIAGLDGRQGSPGHVGNAGPTGIKGEKGERGVPGHRGESGPQGVPGASLDEESSTAVKKCCDPVKGFQTQIFQMQSQLKSLVNQPAAHLCGSGTSGTYNSGVLVTQWYTSSGSIWSPQLRGGMTYSNGVITVPTNGLYYVYATLLFYHRSSSHTNGGYYIYVNSTLPIDVLHVDKAVGGYASLYVGRIVNLVEGDRLCIKIRHYCYVHFNSNNSFFGAFRLA